MSILSLNFLGNENEKSVFHFFLAASLYRECLLKHTTFKKSALYDVREGTDAASGFVQTDPIR